MQTRVHVVTVVQPVMRSPTIAGGRTEYRVVVVDREREGQGQDQGKGGPPKKTKTKS